MLPEKLVKRYLSVKALAQRGVGGERRNARSILEALEKRHPTLSLEADAQERREKGEDVPEPPPGVWNGYTPPPQAKSGGNWENLFQHAQAAFQGVYGFASTLTNVVSAQNMANEHVEVTARQTRAGSVILSAKMSEEVFEIAADQLTEVQKVAFRDTVLRRLKEHLDAIVWSE